MPSAGWRAKASNEGSKVGLADLEAPEEPGGRAPARHAGPRARPRPPRKPAAESANPADDAEALRRSLRSVTPIKRDARVEHKPWRRPRLRRANALGETRPAPTPACPTAAKSSTCCPKAAPPSCAARAAPDTARNLRRGQWRAGAELDLHGLRVEQARHPLLSFLDECQEHGIRCVRIVHGKGYGSQGLEPVLRTRPAPGWCRRTRCWRFPRRPSAKAAPAPCWCCCARPREPANEMAVLAVAILAEIVATSALKAPTASRGCCRRW